MYLYEWALHPTDIYTRAHVYHKQNKLISMYMPCILQCLLFIAKKSTNLHIKIFYTHLYLYTSYQLTRHQQRTSTLHLQPPNNFHTLLTLTDFIIQRSLLILNCNFNKFVTLASTKLQSCK